MLDTPSPSRLFDSTALTQWMRQSAHSFTPPWLHGEVARRMAERLSLILKRPQRVMDWWPSLGGSTSILRSTYPQAQYWGIEPTTDWLRLAQQQHPRRSWWDIARWQEQRPLWRLASEVTPDDPAMDFIWANMAVHHSADPLMWFRQWNDRLASEGFVMFSCLGPDSLKELRQLYRRHDWGDMGAAFVDMHDLGDMLIEAGFAHPVLDQEIITLTWSSPQAMLAELRQMGCNTSPQRFQGLRTLGWKQQLESALQQQANADGRLQLSFEVAYGHAFKAEPRAPVQAQTHVSVDTMRQMLRRKPTTN